MWEVRGDDWRLKEGEHELWDKLVEAAAMPEDIGKVIDL